MKLNFPKSKWFIAFVITLVLAIAATTVAIVIGAIANRPPEYTEGDEMGVYYYDVEDGEVLLTLSTGNNFTISGPTLNMNKTGTYTVEGDTLTLTFFKEADGTTTATFKGDILELIYNGAKMNFLEKTNYTVNFNVNGGSAIDSVKVVNGKAVSQPADPTKDNSVFLGWYEDEAFKTPFNFATTPIKKDTTIYAKWATKTFGVSEYTVSFDLGYEATAPESIITVSGKAYGVKAPERAGYTFGGWYISMYNDASKLSYAYTDDTVFTSDTTLYAVWYEDGATKLNAPAVSVSGNRISWTQVSGSNGYILTVTAPDGTAIIDGESIAATVKTFDFSAYAPGEYVVSVVAKADNEENNSEAVRYYANKTLAPATGFQVINGILMFNTVENADKYIITIDCGNDKHNHTAIDNGNLTIFNMTYCPMQAGGINITVVAEGEGYASSTTTYNYDLSLDKIVKVEYDASKDAFIWEAVEGANEYIVTVTVGENTTVINNGSSTTFGVAGFTGEVTVSVVPSTLGYNSPEGTEATCQKTAPAKPDGITVNNMVITWAPAAGATSYEVKIGDQTITVTTNSLDITTSGLTLTQGEIYEIQVKAISESNEASVYSDAVKFGYVAMINDLKYSKNTVTWSPILGVTTFKVRVNGGTEMTVTDANFARVTLTQEGENLIEVKFVAGEDESDWASITVVAYAVEYDTRSTFGSFYTEYLAIGDEFTLPGENTFANNKFFKDGYDMTAWSTSPMGNASNGALLSEGDIFTGTGYTVLYGTWTPKDYTLTLITNGSRYPISNITDGQEEKATYNQAFTLPVPDTGDPEIKFAGWFTQKNGAGEQITDGEGNSLKNYYVTWGQTLYPHFNGKELAFSLVTDKNGRKTYSVKAGPGIREVSDIVIPVTYNGLPVTIIDDGAFNSYDNIKSIAIPDTIELIGQKAFRSALRLEKVEVYVADPTQTYETFYASANGALIRYDMGTVYLECVPKSIGALTEDGSFVIPDMVTALKVESFRYTTNVTTIVIPNNVVEFPASAIHGCSSLKNIKFLERTNPLNFEYTTISSCGNLETITFPSNLEMEIGELTKYLGQFSSLKAVNITEGNKNYSSISGMLVNAAGDTIVYCPKGYTGSPVIPQTISKIDANAFAGCTKISSINIPIWVTSIGNQAFNGASGITEITFDGDRSSDLTIGDGAFRGCNSLTTVTFQANELPDGVTKGAITVSENAFTGGSEAKLETVTVGEGVVIKSLGANAFYQQTKLTTFDVAKTATLSTIGSNAFDGCTSLKSFRIPATVTSIGQYAFNGCTSISDLTFDAASAEDATLSISTYAFSGCTKIRTVVLPDHLTSFNSAAFEGCTALVSITVNDTNKLYKSEKGILYKKSSAESDDFAELLFYPTGLIIENKGIIDNLPSTLVAIGGSAFSNNGNLISITLPAKITTIGNSAFANCTNLNEVIFLGATDTENAAEKLTLGTSAFENCAALEKFVLPAYTTSIGSNALKASGIINFTVPANTTSISSGAFNNCVRLQSVSFGNTGSLSIANTLFKGCTALTTVDLGANVSAIGTSAFEGCTALTTVSITTTGSKLTKIGNKAFYNCPNLASIDIPKTVTAIGTQAFAATKDATGSLTSVNFELGGTSALHIYKQAFQYQSELKSITFPARVSLFTGSENTTTDGNGNKIAKPVTVTNFNSKTTDNGIAAMFLGCYSLENINIAVEEGVDATVLYATVDGVLYTADMTVLIFCPAASVGKMDGTTPTYKVTIPNTVTLVMSKAFQDNTKITTIDFEEFDETDTDHFAKQLLYIGHYSSANKAYAAFGGTSTSITTINLPSHIHTIRGYAFAVTGEDVKPMAININQKANNITLSASAFRMCAAETLTLPAVKKISTTYVFADTKLLTSVSFGYADTSLGNYLFQNSVALQSFTIPATVTTIPTNCFDGCTSLTSVTIPSSVTSIGNYAFQKATSLLSVSIPESVTSIGQSAFANCTALTGITLPSKLATLSASAFIGSGLVSVTIPSSVTTISNQLFKNCKSLTSVTFEGAITSISQEIFFGCENLETINFDGGLSKIKTIGSYALTGCAKITSFPFDKLTSTCTTISNGAFSHTGIKKVDLSKLTSLSAQMTTAFNNMPMLEELVFAPTWNKLPSSITESGDYNGYTAYGMPLDNNPSMKKITLNSKFTTSMLGAGTNPETGLPYYLFEYVSKNCPGLEIVVPGTIASSYKADENGIFFSSDKKILYWVPGHIVLDNYEIPASVETIGNYAFYGTQIKNIVIPRTVKSIGDFAFMNAYSDTITLNHTDAEPSVLNSIGKYAFAGTNITSFVIPDSVTTVGDYTFAYATQLKSITTGSGMTEIPAGFALGVTSLEELNMKEGIITILGIFSDAYTAWSFDFTVEELDYTHSMKSITIPASVQELFGSFYGMNGLETVTFAEGSQLYDLDEVAFAYCTSLQSITVPAGVTELGDAAFYRCTSLKTVDLSKVDLSKSQWYANAILEYTFAYTTSLESILLPANLAEIGNRAFYCSGILSIDIPASVTGIGLEAFENATRLKTITFAADSAITVLEGQDIYYSYTYMDGMFPAITDVNTDIFKGTTSLETVILPNTLTAIGAGVFENSGVQKIMMADPSLPSSLAYIGEKAFAGCTRLSYFGYIENAGTEDEVVYNYLANVTEIDTEAFAGCTALTTLDFGRELEYIGDKAFAGCTSLEIAYIPASVVELGGNIYEGVDADKIVVDPTHTVFVLETAVDGTVTLKNIITGKVIGTWIPVVETPDQTPADGE